MHKRFINFNLNCAHKLRQHINWATAIRFIGLRNLNVLYNPNSELTPEWGQDSNIIIQAVKSCGVSALEHHPQKNPEVLLTLLRMEDEIPLETRQEVASTHTHDFLGDPDFVNAVRAIPGLENMV